MAAKCMNCNKGMMLGHRVSHSKRRTNHAFKVNLQKKTFIVEGRKISVRICANCIKLSKFIDRKKKEELANIKALSEASVAVA